MKQLKILTALAAAFALGVVCCVAGCSEEPKDVGNFIFARKIYQPTDNNWPEVVEYTYAGNKKFLVFVKKDQLFVIED